MFEDSINQGEWFDSLRQNPPLAFVYPGRGDLSKEGKQKSPRLTREDVFSVWIGASAMKSGMNQVRFNTSPVTNVAIKIQQATS
jgi:hypothetical protein